MNRVYFTIGDSSPFNLQKSSTKKQCSKHSATCGREPSKKEKKTGELPVYIKWPGQKMFAVPGYALRQHWPGLGKKMLEQGLENADIDLAGEENLDLAYKALSWIFHRIDHHSRQTCRYKPIEDSGAPDNPFGQLLADITALPTDTVQRTLDRRDEDRIGDTIDAIQAIGRILQHQVHRESQLASDLRSLAESLIPFTGKTGLYNLAHAMLCIYGQSGAGFKNFLRQIPRGERRRVLGRAAEDKLLGRHYGTAIYEVLKTVPGATYD